MQNMGLTRLLNYLIDNHNPEDISQETWAALWEGDEEDPIQETVRRFAMEFDWERLELIDYIREVISQRKVSNEALCFTGHHDLDENDVCRRCGGYFDPVPIVLDLNNPADDIECGEAIEHLAEPGDIACRRCGAELSLEDVVRLTVPAIAESSAEAMRIAYHMTSLFEIPPQMLGLPESDPEPPTYEVVELPWDWWGLVNIATDTVVVKVYGPGAREDIVERWNVKTAVWMAWKARNS